MCSKMFDILFFVILFIVNDVQSRYVRLPEIHRSVVHKKVIATWDEAQRRCEAEGAIIASPLDEEMVEYMKSSIGINNHTTPYFIGIKATRNPEILFASVEGVPLDHLPESAMNMIDQLDPQDGDCLSMDRHNIRIVSCRARLPYICYKNDSSTSTTATPVDVWTTDSKPEVTTETDGDCGTGYISLSGRYYKVHTKKALWDKARSNCASEGGYLVVLNDAQEATTISNYAFNIVGSYSIFVGVSDSKKNGNWRSVLGDRLDEIFHTWSNSRSGSDHYCGVLRYGVTIDDMRCNYEYPYVCEKQC